MPTSLSTRPPQPPLLRVLLVDDMPTVRKELCTLLQLTGEVQVVGEAANGRDAVRQAQALRPDVVLMDLEMPGGDGVEATREIKAQPLASRVVILSVHADPGDEQRARQAGADAFVPKGASLETLMLAILNPALPLVTRKAEEND
jgi:DNA-binding NarL/FixJ family response regulator